MATKIFAIFFQLPKIFNALHFQKFVRLQKNFMCSALTRIKVNYYLKTPSEFPVNKVSPLGSTDNGAHNNELPPDVYSE